MVKISCIVCKHETSHICMGRHMFNRHLDVITTALRRKYTNSHTPIAPLTANINDNKKESVICLCCKNIWTSRKSYLKHIAESPQCDGGNQITELEILIGKQFNDVAKTQTHKNQYMIHIEMLNKKIIKLEEIVLQNVSDINNLKLRLKNQPAVAELPSTAPPAAPPKPIKPTKTVCANCDECDERYYRQCDGKHCRNWIHGLNNEDDWPDHAKCVYQMCQGDDCDNTYCDECAEIRLNANEECAVCFAK